ncbi:MAG: hypothetical protein Q8O83_01240 [bacterium]|nr:hypothetical protein [bacterium]
MSKEENTGFYSRVDAARVLRKVAKETEYGSYPQEVTPFELGRAVSRALINYNGSSLKEAFAQLKKGFWANRDPEHGAQKVESLIS